MGVTATSSRIQTEQSNYGPFLDIGFGFLVNVHRVTSILPYVGKLMHYLYRDRKAAGKFIDATRGRAKKSIIVLDTGEIIGSAFLPATIANRQL